MYYIIRNVTFLQTTPRYVSQEKHVKSKYYTLYFQFKPLSYVISVVLSNSLTTLNIKEGLINPLDHLKHNMSL